MARTNKYASLNFNDIYEKKITTTNSNNNKKPHNSSSSLTSPNKTILSNSRIHGNMLVLTRPSPKPISQPSPTPPQQPPSDQNQTRFEPEPEPIQLDSISLRPLGRTGTGPSLFPSPPIKDKDLSVSPKTNKFVPPHLRPGFLGREEKPAGPAGGGGVRSGTRQGHFGSPNLYGEEGRPKSGGGYERMRRGFEADPQEMNRPGSSGTRPSSSG